MTSEISSHPALSRTMQDGDIPSACAPAQYNVATASAYARIGPPLGPTGGDTRTNRSTKRRWNSCLLSRDSASFHLGLSLTGVNRITISKDRNWPIIANPSMERLATLRGDPRQPLQSNALRIRSGGAYPDTLSLRPHKYELELRANPIAKSSCQGHCGTRWILCGHIEKRQKSNAAGNKD